MQYQAPYWQEQWPRRPLHCPRYQRNWDARPIPQFAQRHPSIQGQGHLGPPNLNPVGFGQTRNEPPNLGGFNRLQNPPYVLQGGLSKPIPRFGNQVPAPPQPAPANNGAPAVPPLAHNRPAANPPLAHSRLAPNPPRAHNRPPQANVPRAHNRPPQANLPQANNRPPQVNPPPAQNRPHAAIPAPVHNRPQVANPPPVHNRPPQANLPPAPNRPHPVVPPPAHNIPPLLPAFNRPLRPAIPPPPLPKSLLPPPKPLLQLFPPLPPPPPLQLPFRPLQTNNELPNIPQLGQQQQQPYQERPRDDVLGGFGGDGDLNDIPEVVIFDITSEVLNLFANADPDWVAVKVRDYFGHTDVVSTVCNFMLENDFPKVNNNTNNAASPEPQKQSEDKKINYFTEYMNPSLRLGTNAERQAHRLLQNEFRRLSCYTIGAAMALFHQHYAPTKKCLEELINNNEAVKTAYNSSKYSRMEERRVRANVTVKENGEEVVHQLRVEVNKSIRGKHFVASVYEPELQKEMDFFNKQVKCDAEERDRQLALELNEHQYEAEGQLIECGCCYGDTTFDDMVQCSEGHLFCQTCLQRYTQEATYGEGKAQIVCMTDGCDSIFPRSQLEKALTTNDLAKYDDRVGEESLQLADMGENLVRCPNCNYAALMGEGDKVFQCQAADCKKETCRYCKEEWKDHFGIPCDEIEKKSDTKVRVSYEERMTMAKIRTCNRCKAGFTKSEGCNKMTCRCGSKMCYICRKPNIDYNHFCRHPRDPGHSCKQCSDCSLWSNPEEDDERAVQEIRKQMEDEKKAGEKRAAAAATDDGGPDAKRPRTE